MAELTIKDLDEGLYRTIERRAAALGMSVDEAARELLRLGLLIDVEGRVAVADKIRQLTGGHVAESSTNLIRRLRRGG
jgi:plasmid stability protein